MENKYIEDISKATAYFAFRNGPAKELYNDGKLTDEDVKKIQSYMEGHIAYLYKTLLYENNIKKFELIMTTMNNFYVSDKEEVKMMDDGFDAIYNQLFPKTTNINIEK